MTYFRDEQKQKKNSKCSVFSMLKYKKVFIFSLEKDDIIPDPFVVLKITL